MTTSRTLRWALGIFFLCAVIFTPHRGAYAAEDDNDKYLLAFGIVAAVAVGAIAWKAVTDSEEHDDSSAVEPKKQPRRDDSDSAKFVGAALFGAGLALVTARVIAETSDDPDDVLIAGAVLGVLGLVSYSLGSSSSPSDSAEGVSFGLAPSPKGLAATVSWSY